MRKFKSGLSTAFHRLRRKKELLAGSAGSAMTPNHPDQGVSVSEVAVITSSSGPSSHGAGVSGAQVLVHGEQPACAPSQSGSPDGAHGTDPTPVVGVSAHSVPVVLPPASPPSLEPAQAPNPETAPGLADSTPAADAVVAISFGKPEHARGTPSSLAAGQCAGDPAAQPSVSAGPSPSGSLLAASDLSPSGAERYPETGTSFPPTLLRPPPCAIVPEPVSAESPHTPASSLDPLVALAVAKYKQKTGVDLNQMNTPLPRDSDEALTGFLEECHSNFTHSRDRFPERIRKPLRALAGVLRPFCSALGEGTALAIPAGKVIFAGLEVLLRATEDVHGDLDAIVAAFDKITDILPHIRIVAGSSSARNTVSDLSQSPESTIPRASETLTARQRAADRELGDTDKTLREGIIDVLVAILEVLGILRSLKGKRLKTWVNKLGQDKGPLADPVARLNGVVAKYQGILQASIHQNTTHIQHGVSDIHSFLEAVRADARGVQNTQENAAMVQWLRRSDPSARFNRLFDNRCQNTGTWFLANEAFRDFKSGETVALWLRGQAGSGKSSMIAAAIDELNIQCAANPHQITLYHFFDATRRESCTLRALLGTLACQLLHKEATSRELLKELYTKCEGSEPSLRDLKETTLALFRRRHTANALTRTYVVIDALDEADGNAKQVLAFIRVLHELGPQTSLLVASRPEFSDVSTLRRLFSVPVDMQDVGILHDVELVVKGAFEAGGALENVRADLQPVVKDRLLSNAKESFLWVTLQIEALSEHAEVPMELERRLAEIPLTLAATYESSLSSQLHVRRLLVWMAEDAIGPVSPDMLTELLACDHSDPMHPDFRGKTAAPTMDGAIRLIGTAFVTQTKPDSRDRTYIVFTHNSVKDFVLQFGLFNEERRHHHIRISSMFAAYIHGLSDDDACRVLAESYDLSDARDSVLIGFHRGESLKDNLYTAAHQHWMTQLGLAFGQAEAPVCPGLIEHAETVACALTRYFSCLGSSTFSPFNIQRQRLPRNDAFTALSVACSFGKPLLVEFLLRSESWTPGQISHALACVSLELRYGSQRYTPGILLARTKDSDPEAAERSAAEKWSLEDRDVGRVVQLLLEHNHNCDGAERVTCTAAAIQHLCHVGYATAVRHLCHAGIVDLNASVDPEGGAEPPIIMRALRSNSQLYRRLKRLARVLESSSADISSHQPLSTPAVTATPRFAFLDHIFSDRTEEELKTRNKQILPLHRALGRLIAPGYLGPILTGAAICGAANVIRVILENHPDLTGASEALTSALNAGAVAGHVDVIEVLAPYCSDEAKVEAFLCGWTQRPWRDDTALSLLPALSSLTTPIAAHAYVLFMTLSPGGNEKFAALLDLADVKVKGLVTYHLHFKMQAVDHDGIFALPVNDAAVMKVIFDIALSDDRLVAVPHSQGQGLCLGISLSPNSASSDSPSPLHAVVFPKYTLVESERMTDSATPGASTPQ